LEEEPRLWYWQETKTRGAYKQKAGYVAFLKFTGAKLRKDKKPATLEITVEWDPQASMRDSSKWYGVEHFVVDGHTYQELIAFLETRD